MASLGQELKRARENRGVTLHEIANATHIGVRFLQAIEGDSYDILPGGVFNRAFVRKFAKQVGYDEEQAIKLYEDQLNEMGGEPQRRYYTGLDDMDPRPSSGNGMLFTLLTLAVLAAGAYLAYSYFTASPTPAESGEDGTTISSTPTPVAPVAPVASVEPTPAPTPEIITGLKMQVTGGAEQCWVKIAADDGKGQEAIIQPGEVREFSANNKLLLNIGNLPGVKITINGKQLNPAKLTQGVSGIVAKNVVITKENYLQFVD